MARASRKFKPLVCGIAAACAAAIVIGALPGCALAPMPKPIATFTCAPARFPIYFAKGSDELSDQAHDAIRAGADLVRTCKVTEVDVFGLTSADGTASVDMELSKRRAANVAQALAAAGLPQPLFDVEGLGASTAHTVQGRPAMLQRKTLVVIQVAPTPTP